MGAKNRKGPSEDLCQLEGMLRLLSVNSTYRPQCDFSTASFLSHSSATCQQCVIYACYLEEVWVPTYILITHFFPRDLKKKKNLTFLCLFFNILFELFTFRSINCQEYLVVQLFFCSSDKLVTIPPTINYLRFYAVFKWFLIVIAYWSDFGALNFSQISIWVQHSNSKMYFMSPLVNQIIICWYNTSISV